MPLPIGLVCMKCGTEIGAILSPISVTKTPLQAACPRCINAAASASGMTAPKTDADWDKVAAQLGAL